MTQPTALFLADILEDAGKPADIAEKCAAEMRRLHAQRDALLEALILIASDACADMPVMMQNIARAAIKAAEENTCQRKPLTDDAIEKAYREIWRDLPNDFDHTSAGWIEMGIKYAERAHGIK